MSKRRVLYFVVCLGLLIGLLPATISAQSFADPAFQSVWQRTDKPVAEGRVARSWVWGPQPFTEAMYETYAEAPGGTRMVQYFDKSRMEINDPNADRNSSWFVTNGLLVREMVDGRIAIGDSSYSQSTPSYEAVVGDPAANNPNCPTYATFQNLSWQRAADRTGQAVIAVISPDGTVWEDSSKAGYAGTDVVYYEGTLGHNVPRVFWDFMNQSGLVYEGGGYRTGQIVDWLYAMGYPITEPYWTRATVGGVEKDVMVQLFERRVLSYTPSNPAGWQVEMGNVGQHYYNWRYGGGGAQPTPPPSEPISNGDLVKTADGPDIYLIEKNKRRAFPDWDTFVGMGYSMDMVRIVSQAELDAIPLGNPLPSVHACQAGMALVRVKNHIGGFLTLKLTGPESVTLYVPSYSSKNYCVYSGQYSYYTTVSGYGSKSGSKTLKSGNCQCWDWYLSGFSPPPCDCSNNRNNYSRP